MKLKLNQGFLTQKIGDKTTIFEGENSILHTLNETAAYIFQGIKLGWNEKKIVEGLVKKHNRDELEIEKDVKKCISELVAKKILTEE